MSQQPQDLGIFNIEEVPPAWVASDSDSDNEANNLSQDFHETRSNNYSDESSSIEMISGCVTPKSDQAGSPRQSDDDDALIAELMISKEPDSPMVVLFNTIAVFLPTLKFATLLSFLVYLYFDLGAAYLYPELAKGIFIKHFGYICNMTLLPLYWVQYLAYVGISALKMVGGAGNVVAGLPSLVDVTSGSAYFTGLAALLWPDVFEEMLVRM